MWYAESSGRLPMYARVCFDMASFMYIRRRVKSGINKAWHQERKLVVICNFNVFTSIILSITIKTIWTNLTTAWYLVEVSTIHCQAIITHHLCTNEGHYQLHSQNITYRTCYSDALFHHDSNRKARYAWLLHTTFIVRISLVFSKGCTSLVKAK
jgi:hypothetical protein